MNKYLYGVKYGTINLTKVPANERNKEICLAAIKRSGSGFKDVPKEVLTEEFYLELITHNAYIISDIPDKELTEKMCLQALQIKPYLLTNLLKRLETNDKINKQKLYLEALKKGADLIDEVSDGELTEEICLAAVPISSSVSRKIFKRLKIRGDINKEKIYLEAVKKKQNKDIMWEIGQSSLG